MPELKRVDIAEIGASLFPFRLYRTNKELDHSVQEHGLIQPPLLASCRNEYAILDGAARIWSAKNKFNDALCLVYDEGEMDEKAMFCLYLEANLWARGFHTVEKAFCLKFADLIFESRIPVNVLQALDVPDSRQVMAQYGNLCRLSETVLEFISQLALKLSAAARFFHYSIAEGEALVHMLKSLPLNQNKLVQIMDFLADICRRDGSSSIQVLREALQAAGHENDAQKREQGLRDLLGTWRYPRYEKQRDDFSQKLVRLSLPNSIQIKPAPYFEDDYIELTCRISSDGERKKLIECLTQQEFERFFIK